jgi:hypothetical protein
MAFQTDIYVDKSDESIVEKLRLFVYGLFGGNERNATRRMVLPPKQARASMPGKRIFWRLASRGSYYPEIARAGNFYP